MKTLFLTKVNYGNHYLERNYCDRLKLLDGKNIELSETNIIVDSDIRSSLTLYEKDSITTTWVGSYEDGTKFRVVCPNQALIPLTGNNVTIASMYKDGYAVHFNIL